MHEHFALGWEGQAHGALWITGDTVLYDGVRQVADRLQVATALLHLGCVLRRATRGGQLPVRWLLAEWPDGESEPTKYWLASLPQTTRWSGWSAWPSCAGGWSTTTGVEGRAGAGPLRGALLAGLAASRDPGVGRPRLRHPAAAGPKSPCVGLTIFQALRELQFLVACWAGACPVCLRSLPRSTAWVHPSAAPT
jgi:hypothetical protein